jgi:TonB-dependent starch-binding outer membrane protein SusC
MKKTKPLAKILLLYLFLITFTLNASAQKVTLSFQNETFEKVLNSIKQQTGLDLVYRVQIVDLNRKVSINVNSINVEDALKQILTGTNLGFEITNNKLYLTEKERTEQENTSSTLKKITGLVTDEKGDPIIGATILEINSNQGTVTDYNGYFSLNVINDGQIKISYVGYESQTVSISGKSSLKVSMTQTSKDLEEIVVVGYGTQRKKDLTGAVSIVDTKIINSKTATTIADLLQGAATGVYVRGGSLPGGRTTIQIRGINSLTNNNPLFVIDGLLTDGNNDFNPDDIESIQILKDASSAAIYGSRAANGVIVITTKKGKEGPLKVELSVKKAYQITPRYALADREEFIRLNDMAYANAGVPSQDHRPDVNTNWQNQIFQTGTLDEYNARISGGSKNSSYMLSGNYLSNEGTLIGTQFDRFSFRVNTEAKKGILKIGENLSVNKTYSTEMPSLNPYWEVLRMLPTIPVYDDANPGGYGYGDGVRARTFGSNPVALRNLQNRTNNNYRLRGNVYAELEIAEGLKYKANYGLDADFYFHRYLRREGTWTYNQPANDLSELYEPSTVYFSSIIDNTISYDKKINKHAIDALAGITYQSERYETKGALTKDLLKTPGGDYFQVLDAGASGPQVFGNLNEAKMISYLGRINYNYDDKYLVSATIRSDGSSRFKKGQRWGTFPSISAGWRPLKEDFIQLSVIDDLKLRANYGTLGSVNIGSYDYFALININTPALFNNTVQSGATQVRLVNEDIKWETLVQQNYGVDLTLFKNRLALSGEYFISNSKDILYGMPIPTSSGNDGGSPVVNAANVKNNGFELTATWKDKITDFQYNIGINFTTLNNRVVSLGYGETQVKTNTTLSKIGQPMGMWYLIKTDGLFQNTNEILNYKNPDGVVIQPDAKPGDIRYVDHNQDGKITDDDRQLVGSPWAKFETGLNLGAEWKNFDLSMNWFASIGSMAYNASRQLTDRFDDNSNYRLGIEPWEKEGDVGFPRIVYSSTLNSLTQTDRWIEDGSFIRLKNLSIGYNIPKNIISRISIEQCRLSFSAQNILTFTKYSGLDPEFSGSLYARGMDSAGYPNVKGLTFGLNITF